MKLRSSFNVPADRSSVFKNLLDPASMRACIPGCTELERTSDTAYRGLLVNEIAHVRFSAAFSAEITELREPEEVRAVLKGEDRRLASSIRVDAVLTVRPDGDASAVSYDLDLALRGKLGRLGESIVRRRSAEVEQQFVAAFIRVCTGVEPAAPETRPARPTVSWWRRLLAVLRPGSRSAG